MNRKANLVILIVITTVLETGIFTANIPTAVFADSRLIKQDTKQNANCDTAGAASPVSDSCNQRAANNINNGVPTAAKPGTLLVNLVCIFGGDPCPPRTVVDITVTGNNPQPSSFSFTGPGGSQLVTLGVGSFTISQSAFHNTPSVTVITSFSGDCLQTGRFQATGTMTGGQHLTCNIRTVFLLDNNADGINFCN